MSDVIYVERLTLPWVWQHIPDLTGGKVKQVFFIDHDVLALMLARALKPLSRVTFEELRFKITEIKDQEGVSVYLRVVYQEWSQLAGLIRRDFPESIKQDKGLALYFLKSAVAPYDPYTDRKYGYLSQAVLLINVVQWRHGVSLHLFQRDFTTQLIEYAQTKGILLNFMGPYRSLNGIWQKAGRIFSKLNGSLLQALWRHLWNRMSSSKICKPTLRTSEAKLLIESTLPFNLTRPDLVSDLFFVEDQEGIRGSDILFSFNGSDHPVDTDKFKSMSEKGIQAVALTPQSSLVSPSQVPVFIGNQSRQSREPYAHLREYWEAFFKQYNVKVWNSFYKNGPHYLAMSDALRATGGVSAIYQRSYEPSPSVLSSVRSDIIFSFSTFDHDIEQKNGSEYRYQIITGYLGDGRFQHLKAGAVQLREGLMRAGAKHIVTYFDEITIDDDRWFYGHSFVQDNYVFWLEKLLTNPSLGLIFKPKVPKTLRRRLGKVAELLSQAEKTGRCYVFEGGEPQSSFPPAAASLASDITIHENFAAGTAGLESALAGTKTLLMDFEGWPFGSLYQLGNDVIFKDWDSVWKACSDYFKNPASCPRLGDWSAMLNELDPFHDGLAASRMSVFLKEILEGLRKGEARECVIDRAAEKYARRWGQDKVHRGIQT